MNVVIVGNGVAGQTVAEQLRKNLSDVKITIITEESYPFYSRIYLPQYIIDERPLNKLILRKKEWFERNKIEIRLNTRAMQINRDSQTILLQNREKNSNETIPYEKLILATGSTPRKMSFGAPKNLNGIYALRSIADANQIKLEITTRQIKSAFIIGGGLLGIELAYHLKQIIPKLIICEIANHLLPRQLDIESSKILTKYLEKQGISVMCGKQVEQILGTTFVEGIKFTDGDIVHTDLVFQQLGIIPNIELAKQAKLDVAKGIKVNQYLQTSDPKIYAVGDCIEFDGIIWGIIPACLEQAKVAVEHLSNEKSNTITPYKGTYWNTRLKIAGINISCIGISPEDLDNIDKEIKTIDLNKNLCRKVFISNNILKGAIIVGDSNDSYYRNHLNQKIDMNEIELKLQEVSNGKNKSN